MQIQQQRFNLNRKFLLFFYLLISTATVSAQSEPFLEEIYAGVKAVLLHEYDQAFAIFSNLSEQFPNNPTGPFFAATILQSKMMDFETNRWQDEFFELLEDAETRSQVLIRQDLQQTYARFYLGAAMAYKGFYLVRDKRYLPGIRAAITAIDQLEKVVKVDSQMYDAYLGIGNYKYWRSRFTKIFNWLPFFSDHRQEGLRMIRLALEKGTFTRWAAINDLAWIYIDRDDPTKALKYAQMGLNEFPNSRFFLWPAAEAYAKMDEPRQARRLYEKLLLSVTSESINNHYNEILLHLKIAECAFELRDFEEAHFHCNQVLTIEPDKEVMVRIKPKYAKAKKLLKRIRKEKPVVVAN